MNKESPRMHPSRTKVTRTRVTRANFTRSLVTRAMATLTVAALTFGLSLQANGEMLELENGRMLHGEILSNKTTEEGLAFKLFETGGVTTVRWDHILEERRIELLKQHGFLMEDDQTVYEEAHEVLLTNGKKEIGVVLNPDTWQTDGELSLKLSNAVRKFPAAQVQKVSEDTIQVAAVDLYSLEELYQRKLEEMGAVESAELQYEIGVYCAAIGDYRRAKEHLDSAWADVGFRTTPDGRSVPNRLKTLDTLIAAEGAQALVKRVKSEMRSRKWNQALASLDELAEEFPEENIRKAVRYDFLQRQVVIGRDKYFRRRVQQVVYRELQDLIKSKVKERPVRDASANNGNGMSQAAKGSLAASQQWAARDLPTELWEAVAKTTDLPAEEVDRYWTERTGKAPQHANYGTGTFVITKKKKKSDKRERRRPPGSERDNKRRGDKKGPQKKEVKPMTPEEWWTATRPNDRAQWLTAYFVENSGIFELVRTEEAQSPNPINGVLTQRKVVYR